MEKVCKIIGNNVNFTTRTFAEELKTTKNTIWRILTADSKKGVCACFVSHELNEGRKSEQVFR